MVPYRKRRSNYKRRINRKISTRNIFSNRSARSQANQIYALKRRINTVYNRVKPEIKNVVGSSINVSFNSGALSDVWFAGVIPQPTVNGGGNSGLIGDFCRPISIQLNGVFEYYNNSTTGYHVSESSGCSFRVIIVQRKTPEDYTTTHELSEFIPNPAYTGAEYSTMTVKPLQTGITEKWRVLCDKRYILTSDKNQVAFKLRFRPRPFRFTIGDSKTFNYCKFIIVSSGLHFDQDFKEYISGSLMAKLSYTDA